MSDSLQSNIKIVLLMAKLESPTEIVKRLNFCSDAKGDTFLRSIYELDSYEKKFTNPLYQIKINISEALYECRVLF